MTAHSTQSAPTPRPGPLLRKLGASTLFSDDEQGSLNALSGPARVYAPRQDMVHEGDGPASACLMLSGLACRYKLAGRGARRQIMSFHLPGDIVDLHSLFLGVADHSIAALSPTRVMLIPHRDLLSVMDHHPRIGRALWRETLVEAAIFREWLVGIGRRSAYQRIAHLFCELLVKMQGVGLTEMDGRRGEVPITQADLADALGLSTVHVNRVVQALRRANLITWRGTVLTAVDWVGLQRAGEFDDTYLHLPREQDCAA